MHVKKTQMLVNYYLKFENRFLMLIVAILIAMAFAVSSAKAGVKADFTVVNEKTNVWRTQSADGAFSAIKWGVEGDVHVPADFDGDGSVDIAVWRPSNGTWHVIGSRDAKYVQINWGDSSKTVRGRTEDVPVAADFDGDKAADIAIWRPVDGRWYVLTSKSGFTSSIVVEWGKKGDVPVPADYDGDGRADVAIFRPSQNKWMIAESSTGDLRQYVFGKAGNDLLLPADYTGDGRADVAVYRSGVWLVRDSETGDIENFEFGFTDAVPVPADYDGDGTTDFAVYRSGEWFVYESEAPRLRSTKHGDGGDVPLNPLSVKQSLVAGR